MIGKQVPQEELQKVLDEEKAKDKFMAQIKQELAQIKQGECLRYECKGTDTLQWIVLSFIMREVKGLKFTAKGNYTYIYRE